MNEVQKAIYDYLSSQEVPGSYDRISMKKLCIQALSNHDACEQSLSDIYTPHQITQIQSVINRFVNLRESRGFRAFKSSSYACSLIVEQKHNSDRLETILTKAKDILTNDQLSDMEQSEKDALDFYLKKLAIMQKKYDINSVSNTSRRI